MSSHRAKSEKDYDSDPNLKVGRSGSCSSGWMNASGLNAGAPGEAAFAAEVASVIERLHYDRPEDALLYARSPSAAPEPTRLGEEVPRRFVQVLGGQPLPKDCGNSGRLELANWIADPANPLTARVLVNRLWQHHFGRGLVTTPNDFGTRGQAPTHPELLDFLAWTFMEVWVFSRTKVLYVEPEGPK